MKPQCKKCSRRHYNLEKCERVAAREGTRETFERANLMPELGSTREGWRPWRQQPMTGVRLYGGLQVVKQPGNQWDGWKEL